MGLRLSRLLAGLGVLALLLAVGLLRPLPAQTRVARSSVQPADASRR